MLADARAVRAYQEQRFRDVGFLAEREGPVRGAPAVASPRMPFYCQALILLGRWMVAQGWSLQQRYGAESPPVLSQPANHPAN